MNRYLDEWTLTNYQNMGFDLNLIIQAWEECQGNENLMIDHLFQLSSERHSHNKRRGPHLRTAETARLLKKLPRTHHLKLKFEGDDSLKFLELRKLGLFSKRVFRCIKGLSLDYANKHDFDPIQTLKKKHMEILGNHMYRNLRKLKLLSIKFDFWKTLGVFSVKPLFKSLGQAFVALKTLKLSLGDVFTFAERATPIFGRLFASLGSTLKHLDLDFSRTPLSELDFSRVLARMIMKHLRKLETLCLNFDLQGISGTTIRLLIWGACTHLTCLKTLDISASGCWMTQEGWQLAPFKFNLTSNLRSLKLNLTGCFDLSPQCLSTLQEDIVELCPKLEELYVCTLSCIRFSNQFYASLEKEFLRRLNLKRFRLHYSNDLDNTWAIYPELQTLELAQEMKIEEEVMNFKERVGGEEGMQAYYQTKMEEERAPKESEREVDEQEYLQWRLDESERIELEEFDRAEIGIRWEVAEDDKVDSDYGPNSRSRECYDHSYEENDYVWEQVKIGWEMEQEEKLFDSAEVEIRCRDLTQGGLIPEICLDYGDS